MPIIQDSISIAANATNNDVLSGKRAKILPLNAAGVCKLFQTGSATGLYAELFVGGRNPMESGLVNANNRIPLDPDDMSLQNEVALPGDQLYLPVRNTTAGALTYFYRLIIELISPSQVGM